MSKPVPGFRVDHPSLAQELAIGDHVRSYDFAYHDDCYIEGTLMDVGVEVEGCRRYQIAAMFRAFDGKQEVIEGDIFPPVNGTRVSTGGYCNGVRRVEL